jgi:AcrR family transcriptional regulator
VLSEENFTTDQRSLSRAALSCENMGRVKASELRARARAEMIEEIKAVARKHLATDGANLSLRAVARDMGMVSSAVYRYFPSRDELLTALIIDAYNALGEAVESTEARIPRDDLTGRWIAACHAVRHWALASPHQYALIYGSPVPGYRAPQDTVPAATRTVAVLGGILQDGMVSGALVLAAEDELADVVAAEVGRVAAVICPDVPPSLLSRGMGAWVALFGMVSFELFGQFNNTIEDRWAFFDHQMRTQAAFVGL